MTLLVGIATKRHAFMVSDRRITNRERQVISLPGESEFDESNKAFVISLRDANAAAAFTGLASSSSGFFTKWWLAENLADCAKPEWAIAPCLDRLAGRLTRTFQDPQIANGDFPTLSIIFAGFRDCAGIWEPSIWLVSNVENLDGRLLNSGSADNCFHVFQSIVPKNDFRLHIFGAKSAVDKEERAGLERLIRQEKGPQVIQQRAVKLIQRVSKSHRSANVVGSHCSCIIVSSHNNPPFRAFYHPDKTSLITYMPTYIQAQGDGLNFTAAEGIHCALDQNDSPVPLINSAISRNQFCPCGSKLKYKKCHGLISRKPSRYTMTVGENLQVPLPNPWQQ